MKDKVQIIFEDEQLLVIDKPSGLVVHNDSRTIEETLSQWVVANYPKLANVGGTHMLDMGRTEPRCGIVNRLDREVSGCILIGKNEASFQFLAEQFLHRNIIKKYIAVVDKVLDREIGEEFDINEPIGRHRKDPRRWAIGAESRNTKREAITKCKIIKKGQNYSVLELQPITGRTHQLRLHVNALGASILGDKKYFLREDEIIESRIMLHAKSLTFKYPKTEEFVSVESKTPAEFLEFIN